MQSTESISTSTQTDIDINTSPLLKPWCLYAWRRGRHSQNQDYQLNLIPLATMSSLPAFFGHYLSLKLPSECEIDSKVMFFQLGCRPMWQDWEESGTLQLSFKERSEGGEGEALDAIWEYLLFSLVGNQLGPEVIGLCFNKHPKQTLVDVWLRSAARRTEIMATLEKAIFRDVEHLRLKLKREIRFKYVEHRHNLKSQHRTIQALPHPSKFATREKE